MRQTDENFVSMCRAVQEVLNNHTSIWETIAAFKTQVDDFNALVENINIAAQGAEIVSTGATQDKATAELQAVLLAVNLAKRASIYALNNANSELHDQLRVTKTTLLRRPDTLTVAKLRDIHTRINNIIADLTDYGVTPADLTKLKTLTDKFDNLLSRPRTLIVERKTYNQDEIPGLLTQIREILYKTDSLINLFEGTAFAKEYKTARIIIDLGSRKNQTDVPPTT